MDNRKQLVNKKEVVEYEMNAVRKYIEGQEYDDQLKEAWDKDEKEVRKLDHIIEKFDHQKHHGHH